MDQGSTGAKGRPLGQNRRLSKDYERLCETSESLIYAAMSRLMMRRLARA
jgi:putative transposase